MATTPYNQPKKTLASSQSAEPAPRGVYVDDLFSRLRALRLARFHKQSKHAERRPRVAAVAFD